MNATLHQWKWDLRRIWMAWVLWLLLVAGTAVIRFLHLVSMDRRTPWAGLSDVLQWGGIVFGGMVLTSWLTRTTPFSGSDVHWRTRPLGQASLFWQKSLAILLMVILPGLAALVVPYAMFVPDALFVAHTSAGAAVMFVVLIALAAVWSALASRVSLLAAYPAATLVLFQLVGFLAYRFLSPVVRPTLPPGWGDWKMVLVLGVLVVLLVICWILQARCRRSWAALTFGSGSVALAAAGLVLVTSPEKSTTQVSSERLDLHVRERDDQVPAGHAPVLPQFYGELRDDEVLFLMQLSGKLLGPDDGAVEFQPHLPNRGRLVTERVVGQFARFFPEGAQLIDHDERYEAKLRDLPGQSPLDGFTFSGTYLGYLLSTECQAILPVVDQASAVLEGSGRVQVVEVGSEDGRLGVKLAMRTWMSTPHRHHDSGWFDDDDRYLVLAHHPERNVLLVPQQQRSSGSGWQRLRQRTVDYAFAVADLRAVFGESPRPSDLAELNLHVFSLEPEAMVSGSFRQQNWVPFEQHPLPGEAEPEGPAWAEVVLPDEPTDREVEEYLDHLLYRMPEQLRGFRQADLIARFTAIGPVHVDKLLARCPVPRAARGIVLSSLGELCDERHLPMLLETLSRDLSLASVFLDKGWEAHAAPLLAEFLHQRRPHPYIGSIIALVARQQDPQTYRDLAWHFVHSLDRGHLVAVGELEQCPDFPLEATVMKAWREALSGTRDQSVGELMVLAARHGEREALRQTLAGQMATPHRNVRFARALSPALAHPEGTDPIEWAYRNFGQLRFDPERQVYRLTSR